MFAPGMGGEPFAAFGILPRAGNFRERLFRLIGVLGLLRLDRIASRRPRMGEASGTASCQAEAP